MPEYDDDYPTCVSAFATLRFYHKMESPKKVTDLLKVEPSETQKVGPCPQRNGVIRRVSGWFLCSKGQVESRDVRRHVDWVLDQIEGSKTGIPLLAEQGWSADVFCYWLGTGQGGPMLDPFQMARLSSLNLSCGFDVYYDTAD